MKVMPTGLPRPLAPYGDKLKPVSWSQDGDAWGIIEPARQCEAIDKGLCLLCGEQVNKGYVVVSDDHGREVFGIDSLGYLDRDVNESKVLDGAPLHDRCLKLTLAHCDHQGQCRVWVLRDQGI